jgi:predicted chitinase
MNLLTLPLFFSFIIYAFAEEPSYYLSINVTQDQFIKGLTSNSFPAPSATAFNFFVNGIPKTGVSSKRELAMFLAQIMHESGGLQVTSESACGLSGCYGQYDSSANGISYYGRGYIQLTGRANYAAASKYLYGDENVLLNNPNTVATNVSVAWDVSFWFWKAIVHPAPGVTDGLFGASTKAINGALECNGGVNDEAKQRFLFYKNILQAFSVSDTPIESGCYY